MRELGFDSSRCSFSEQTFTVEGEFVFAEKISAYYKGDTFVAQNIDFVLLNTTIFSENRVFHGLNVR